MKKSDSITKTYLVGNTTFTYPDGSIVKCNYPQVDDDKKHANESIVEKSTVKWFKSLNINSNLLKYKNKGC